MAAQDEQERQRARAKMMQIEAAENGDDKPINDASLVRNGCGVYLFVYSVRAYSCVFVCDFVSVLYYSYYIFFYCFILCVVFNAGLLCNGIILASVILFEKNANHQKPINEQKKKQNKNQTNQPKKKKRRLSWWLAV